MADIISLARIDPKVARRERARLTAPMVRSTESGRYSDGNGLYLDVTAPHAASWVVRYTVPRRSAFQAGKRRDMGIGPARGVRAISLADARGMAIVIQTRLRQGIDPLAERRAVEEAEERATQPVLNFATVAERYVLAHEAGWQNAKHRQQWRSTLARYVTPRLGALAIDAITTVEVLGVLQPIWQLKPETASRVRMRIGGNPVLPPKAQGWRSSRRQPMPLAWPSATGPAGQGQGAAGKASCRARLARSARLHAQARRAIEYGRPGAGVRHPRYRRADPVRSGSRPLQRRSTASVGFLDHLRPRAELKAAGRGGIACRYRKPRAISLTASMSCASRVVHSRLMGCCSLASGVTGRCLT